MSKETIQGLINEIIDSRLKGEEFYSEICTVDSVDETTSTCDVTTILNDLELFDVKLNVSEASGVGVVNFPSKGSRVLVSYINKNKAVVSMLSDIDKTVLTTSGGSVITIDDKISIKNGAADFKDLLNSLIDQIELITVPTAFGPSGPPINAAAIAAIQTQFNNLLA